MGQKLTTEEFISRANKEHNNFYDYSLSVYTKALEKLTITCPIHGNFEQIPASHLRGIGCPKCGRVKANKSSSLTTNDFITRANTLHDNFYDYSLVNVERSKIRVPIICPIHGKFEQTPNSHLQGIGCPQCAIEKITTNSRYNLEEFITISNSKHNNKYDYTKSIYVNSQTKLTITCPIHGDFEQKANAHMNGRGCSQCGEIIKRKRYHNEPTLLYMLYFPFLQIYKLGITLERRGIEKRYEIEPKSYVICDTILYSNGKEAYHEEQRLLEKYNYARHTGPNLLVNGNTELFSFDILQKEKELK